MQTATRTQIEGYLTRNQNTPNSRIAGNVSRHEKVRAADVAGIREEMGLPAQASRRCGPKKKISGANGSAPKKTGSGRTLQDFREEHDVAFKIKKAISAHLSDGSEHYYDDADFRQLVGVPVAHWRRYADSSEFEAWRYRKGNHNLWASKALKAQIVEILGM
jgi:hypothetical protein